MTSPSLDPSFGEGSSDCLGHEKMLPSIVLPLLGTRASDFTPFQYMPLSLRDRTFVFSIPRWVVSREVLHEGDKLHFHLNLNSDEREYSEGIIAVHHPEDLELGDIYDVQLSADSFYPHSVRIQPGEGQGVDLLLRDPHNPLLLTKRLLKDSSLLKRGINVYLKHLSPFFSRISEYPSEDYPMFQQTVLADILGKVTEHELILVGYLSELGRLSSVQELPSVFDLEELRTAIESEIYFDLFRVIFEVEAPLLYLRSIKELEKKLYANYNALTVLYSKALVES
jgi:hypothetical protein